MMKFFCLYLLMGFTGIACAQTPKYLPTGIYLGNIEEGARIITFVRLWPKGHPKALGHDYPTLLQFHKSEFEIHLFLGEQLGWNLYATLFRHPSNPAEAWHFDEYSPIEVEQLREAKLITLSDEPIPGLKIIGCLAKQPVAYIIDTRTLSLNERNMTRATSSGLEFDRDKFDQAINEACNQADGDMIIRYK